MESLNTLAHIQDKWLFVSQSLGLCKSSRLVIIPSIYILHQWMCNWLRWTKLNHLCPTCRGLWWMSLVDFPLWTRGGLRKKRLSGEKRGSSLLCWGHGSQWDGQMLVKTHAYTCRRWVNRVKTITSRLVASVSSALTLTQTVFFIPLSCKHLEMLCPR